MIPRSMIQPGRVRQARNRGLASGGPSGRDPGQEGPPAGLDGGADRASEGNAGDIPSRTMTGMPLLLLTLMLAPVQGVFAAEGLVTLIDPLDEPERYCLDVPGWGRRVNLDAPLMAHTCKPGAADELFTPGSPAAGNLYMRAYDRCAEAASSSPGSQLLLKQCSSSELQVFSFESDGRVRLQGSDVCLAVASGMGARAGGPSHLRRDLTLERCDAVEASLSTWKVPSAN